MIRIWLTTLSLTVAAISISAATFKTSRLSKIAAAVGVENIVMSPSSDSLLNYKDQVLVVRTNTLGDVSHIGYKLFSDSTREVCGYSDLCNFIERYTLELDMRMDGRTPQERMDIDRVVISQGSWKMLHNLSTAQLTNVETIKRKMYRMTWDVGGNKLRMTIPADCQLLIGADAPELENIISRDISRIPKDSLPELSFHNVSFSRSDSVEIVQVGHYLSKMIRGDIYYSLRNGERHLYCDQRNPSRSISNIMLTGQHATPVEMSMTVNRYGYKSTTTTVTLSQFVKYCIDEGCSLYFGIKSITDDKVSGTLFVRNDDLGYNHVLSVEFPTAILKGENQQVIATLYAFIPLHNVTDNFFNEK